MAKKQKKDLKAKQAKAQRPIPKKKRRADKRIHKLAEKVNAATAAVQQALKDAKQHDRRVSRLAARLEAELKKARKRALKAQQKIDKARKIEKKADRKLKAAVDAELKRLAKAEKQKQAKAEKQKAAKLRKRRKAKAEKARISKLRRSVSRMLGKRQPLALLNGNMGKKKKGGKGKTSLKKLKSSRIIKAADSLKLEQIKGRRASKQLKAHKYKGKPGKVILFDMRKLKAGKVPS